MQRKGKEKGNILIIVIGLVLVLFLVGFFRSSTFFGSLNFRSLLDLPCGISIKELASGSQISLPLSINGYVNKCGWEVKDGSAGKAQVFDSTGLPVSFPAIMRVSSDETASPFSFSALLITSSPPSAKVGQIIFTSTTGLVYAFPIKF